MCSSIFVFRMFLFFRGTCEDTKSTKHSTCSQMFANVPQRTRHTSPDTPMYWPRGRGGEGKGLFRSSCAQRRGRRHGSALSYTLEESVWCFLLYQTPRGPFGSLLKLLKRFPNQTFDQKNKSQERVFTVRGFTELVLVCWRRSERVSMW